MMFKSFNEVSPTARTKVWNNGFSDYLVPINMTEAQLDNRLSSLSISEELSKVFFIDNQPAGIYLHAEGTFSDQKIAWLGGMAVDSAFRNQQVSVKMLREFERLLLNVVLLFCILKRLTEMNGRFLFIRNLGSRL